MSIFCRSEITAAAHAAFNPPKPSTALYHSTLWRTKDLWHADISACWSAPRTRPQSLANLGLLVNPSAWPSRGLLSAYCWVRYYFNGRGRFLTTSVFGCCNEVCFLGMNTPALCCLNSLMARCRNLQLLSASIHPYIHTYILVGLQIRYHRSSVLWGAS